jgi:hypothetical protein
MVQVLELRQSPHLRPSTAPGTPAQVTGGLVHVLVPWGHWGETKGGFGRRQKARVGTGWKERKQTGLSTLKAWKPWGQGLQLVLMWRDQPPPSLLSPSQRLSIRNELPLGASASGQFKNQSGG